jgi:hypothetical protein
VFFHELDLQPAGSAFDLPSSIRAMIWVFGARITKGDSAGAASRNLKMLVANRSTFPAFDTIKLE